MPPLVNQTSEESPTKNEEELKQEEPEKQSTPKPQNPEDEDDDANKCWMQKTPSLRNFHIFEALY